MGSAQSARKLTIHNEEEKDMIQISNAIAKRLNEGFHKTASNANEEIKSDKSTQQTTANDSLPQSSHSEDLPASGYPVYYYPELTLTALEIQQQKEQELLDKDRYWQSRIEHLEKNHVKINQIINEEYKKAKEELYVNGKKSVNIENTVQPCLENTESVFKCYQEHPKEILKCSSLVEEFSNCVDRRRAQVIATRC